GERQALEGYGVSSVDIAESEKYFDNKIKKAKPEKVIKFYTDAIRDYGTEEQKERLAAVKEQAKLILKTESGEEVSQDAKPVVQNDTKAKYLNLISKLGAEELTFMAVLIDADIKERADKIFKSEIKSKYKMVEIVNYFDKNDVLKELKTNLNKRIVEIELERAEQLQAQSQIQAVKAESLAEAVIPEETSLAAVEKKQAELISEAEAIQLETQIPPQAVTVEKATLDIGTLGRPELEFLRDCAKAINGGTQYSVDINSKLSFETKKPIQGYIAARAKVSGNRNLDDKEINKIIGEAEAAIDELDRREKSLEAMSKIEGSFDYLSIEQMESVMIIIQQTLEAKRTEEKYNVNSNGAGEKSYNQYVAASQNVSERAEVADIATDELVIANGLLTEPKVKKVTLTELYQSGNAELNSRLDALADLEEGLVEASNGAASNGHGSASAAIAATYPSSKETVLAEQVNKNLEVGTVNGGSDTAYILDSEEDLNNGYSSTEYAKLIEEEFLGENEVNSKPKGRIGRKILVWGGSALATLGIFSGIGSIFKAPQQAVHEINNEPQTADVQPSTAKQAQPPKAELFSGSFVAGDTVSGMTDFIDSDTNKSVGEIFQELDYQDTKNAMEKAMKANPKSSALNPLRLHPNQANIASGQPLNNNLILPPLDNMPLASPNGLSDPSVVVRVEQSTSTINRGTDVAPESPVLEAPTPTALPTDAAGNVNPIDNTVPVPTNGSNLKPDVGKGADALRGTTPASSQIFPPNNSNLKPQAETILPVLPPASEPNSVSPDKKAENLGKQSTETIGRHTAAVAFRGYNPTRGA
ncbi:MAG: hypothetical protein WCJ33_05945, partial [Pseudomonadota bacterium]